MPNFTAGTSFGANDTVTNTKLNALIADAVINPECTLSINSGTIGTLGCTRGTVATLNSTTGTIATLNSTTGTIPTLVATTLITTGTGTAAVPAIVPTGDTNTGIFFPSADTIAFSEGGAEAMRIDSSGNVGIATGGTAAASKLDVYGVGNFQSIELGKSGQTGNRDCLIDFTGDDTYSDYGFRIIRNSTGSNAESVLTSKGTGGLFLKTEEAGPIVLQTTNTERLRIDSSGNVGIGTTSPDAKLAIDAPGGSTPTAPISCNATSGAGDRYAALFRYSGTLSGSVTVNGAAAAYNTSSDYRLKTNLEPISNGIERIKQLPVYRFNWKTNENGNKVDGFVAHEVTPIVREAIHGEKDAVDADGNPIYQGIDQSKIVPLLTAALKDAIAKIETLEAKVTALEAA